MPEDMAVDKGVMEMVQPPGMQGMPDMMGGMKPEAGSPNEEDQNDNLAEGDGEAESETKAAPKRAKKEIVLVRKIVHTVVVEDTAEAQVIKKPVVLPGYTRIPFYFWAGQRTPRAGSKGALSVLYALTNGDADPQTGGLGVLQTINELLSLDITIATRFANPPAMTDDEDLIPDTAPGAMNQVRPGRKGLWFVEHPGAPPDVARLTQEMRNEASRVTIPEVLSGQYVSASGQALGIMSSVFDQTLGFAQQDAESALSAMYAQTLELTEYYADPDYGWKVWGAFKRKDFEDWVKPEDIDGDYRVRVRLSSNLPRDMIAMLQTYASLAKGPKPLISMDTFLDLFQKLTDAGADTPVEEKSRILAEMGLFDGPMAKMLGESLGQEYAPLLGVPLPPAAPQPQPQPQGAPSMPGGQSITPDMVAAMGNVQGAMNMQGGPGAQPPGLAGMMGQ